MTIDILADNQSIGNNIIELELDTMKAHKAFDKVKGFTVRDVKASYTYDVDPKPVLTIEFVKGNHVEYVTV